MPEQAVRPNPRSARGIRQRAGRHPRGASSRTSASATSTTSTGVIRAQRGLEVAGRGLLFAASCPPAWLAGTAALSLSKILDNMEIGHNVMHGQYDWTGDPRLDGRTFEWDTACPGEQWRHSHNYMHHTFTNIVGKDRDIGYGILRMSDEQPWRPYYLGNPLYAGLLAVLFQYGVALHDLETERIVSGEVSLAEKRGDDRRDLAQGAPPDAQGLRRSSRCCRSVFPARARRQHDGEPDPQPLGLHDHLLRSLPGRHAAVQRAGGGERVAGQWYFRQLLGSANLTGGGRSTCSSGNLSHPDRAPPVPGSSGPPLRGDRPRGACDVRALRDPLQHRPARQAVRERGAQDLLARLCRREQIVCRSRHFPSPRARARVL